MTFELIDEMERLGTPRILVIGDLILDRSFSSAKTGRKRV